MKHLAKFFLAGTLATAAAAQVTEFTLDERKVTSPLGAYEQALKADTHFVVAKVVAGENIRGR
jgi:cell division ATPase FtsA